MFVQLIFVFLAMLTNTSLAMRRVLNVKMVTQCAMLEDFGMFLVLADKVLFFLVSDHLHAMLTVIYSLYSRGISRPWFRRRCRAFIHLRHIRGLVGLGMFTFSASETLVDERW